MICSDHDEKRFNKIFLNILNEVLTRFLGETAAKVIIHYIEICYDLKWRSIPENLETFSKALKGILGHNAKLIESIIIRKLCVSFNLEKPPPKLSDIEKIKEILESELNRS